MTDKTGYIGYMITNKTNGRYYIGVVKADRWDTKRKARTCPTKGDMPATPYYMGSGVAIRESILEHGAGAFEREIIARFDNFNDADAWERANVVMQEVDPLSYNLQGGGKSGYKIAESTRAKMSEASSGEKNPLFGKRLSAKIRAKISKTMTGEGNPNYGKFGADNPKYNHDAIRTPSGAISRAKRA